MLFPFLVHILLLSISVPHTAALLRPAPDTHCIADLEAVLLAVCTFFLLIPRHSDRWNFFILWHALVYLGFLLWCSTGMWRLFKSFTLYPSFLSSKFCLSVLPDLLPEGYFHSCSDGVCPSKRVFFQ